MWDLRQSHRRGHLDIGQLVGLIIEILEVQMAAIDDLNNAVNSLQSAVTADNAELGAVADGLVAAQRQIADLQAQLAAGGTVSPDQLEALASSLTQVTTSVQAATGAAATETGVTPAPDQPPPAPAGP